MMKIKTILWLWLCMASVMPIHAVQNDALVYRNPVIDVSVPDLTVIRAKDGYFYLYGTENIRNLPIYRSSNLVDWSFVGTAFTDETRPQWNPKGNIWAPDISFIQDKYVLHYAKSEWGGEWTCGIGVATADKPEGPFTDHGAILISKEIGVQNSIDPFYYEDGGHKYLFWGSFRGIYAIELTDDGLKIKDGARKQQVAGTFMEAVYVHKRGDYYYLFGSAGSCCEGNRSTYHVTVGRSKNLFGPYVDKQGRALLDNHYEVVLHGNELVAGPGHHAELVSDDNGDDWMLYHGFSRKDSDAGRKVWLDKVEWIDGWPHMQGSQPSKVSARPVFDEITLADPTIFFDNGIYYLYGTSPEEGFDVYTSKDLETWTGPVGANDDGMALVKSDVFGTTGFWAPQVFKRGSKYYMAYTADEQMAIAEADSPLGPFKQKKKEMLPAKMRQIDPFVFFDDDGKIYLYHVRLINGNRIFVTEMNKNLKSVKEKTARECVAAENGWEDTWNAEWKVCEGPTVVKIDGTYYLFSSCNDYRNPDYAVGYATASSPLGPWIKQKEPLISARLTGYNGTGHGDLFKNAAGEWQYVLHTHRSSTQPIPRKVALVKLRHTDRGFSLVNGSFHFLKQDKR